MKIFQNRLLIFIAILLVSLVACSDDDDDDDVTGPSTANIAGGWTFAGQLTQNTCQLDAISPITGDITFNQSGSIVDTGRVDLNIERGSYWYFYYAGTVAGNTADLSATDPYVFQDGGTVIHFGSGIQMLNIQNNTTGDGSLNVTGQCIQGCSSTCQTIWTGTWTKK